MNNRSPDETDRIILRALAENARISWSALGERAGLSRTAIRKRVAALEHAGLIIGYHAAVVLPPEEHAGSRDNPEKASRKEKTYLLCFETEKDSLSRIAAALREQNGVIWMAELAGKENLTAMVHAENQQDLRQQMQRFTAQQPGILRLRAQEVLSTQPGAGEAEMHTKKERADEQRETDHRDDGACGT